MKKTKVLFIDEGLSFGGSFIVAARLAANLDKDKYDSFIVSATSLDDIRHHVSANVKLFYIRKQVTYKHRIEFYGKIDFLNANNTFQGVLRKLFIYSFSALESIANTIYFFRLCSLIIKHKIDIVHGNNAREAISCARLLGRKIVWHIHGDGRYSAGEVSKYFGLAERYISISNYSTKNAIASGLDSKKIITIHNPTADASPRISPEKKAEMLRQWGIPKGSLIVGIFGRLVEWKGQLEFLAASKIVIEKGHDVYLLLVGSDGENFGGYTAKLKAFADNQIGKDRVKFIGYVKNTDDFYQLCDLVVHASIEPEPFGLVIIEAMKNGVAIIASNKGAGTELVVDGKTGLIADPTNPQVLASAMLTLIENPTLRLECADAAKKYVDENMSPQHYGKKVESIYSDIMLT